MKKSWIIVLAFVFLYSAVPAFSAPQPVPSKLCLQFSGMGDSIRLLPESKGKIGGVEYWGVTGSYVFLGGGLLLDGSLHRKGKKVLHIGLSGTVDEGGPGGGGRMLQVGFDVRYNLKTKKGAASGLFLTDEGGSSGTVTLLITGVDCSSLPKPSH